MNVDTQITLSCSPVTSTPSGSPSSPIGYLFEITKDGRTISFQSDTPSIVIAPSENGMTAGNYSFRAAAIEKINREKVIGQKSEAFSFTLESVGPAAPIGLAVV